MNIQAFGLGSPKSFPAYRRGDFDLESGNFKKTRRPKGSSANLVNMLKSVVHRLHYYYKLHPLLVFLISLSLAATILLILSAYGLGLRVTTSHAKLGFSSGSYPFANLRNLVMVAGHSIYTSSSCGEIYKEDSWFLEPYQKHPGQAATFLTHIKKGVEITAEDEEALLLFSGGETRKDAGPRSEAQSYWAVAESKDWFGELTLFPFFLILRKSWVSLKAST